MVELKINNQTVQAEEGKTILEVARENNIDIPTLCHYPDLHIHSECRVCVVEDNWGNLVTACSTTVRDGMEVKTNAPRVLESRRVVTELMLANHDTNCTMCEKNLQCELQRLASNLGIQENRFGSVWEKKEIDDHNPSVVRNPNRCVKCGRCIEVCKEVQGINVIDYMNRSHETSVEPTYGRYLSFEDCTFCGQCSSVCPVAAITEKDETDKVWEVLHDEKKHVIVQVAPAVRVSLGEEMGQEPGSIVTEQMVAALKKLGFDRVFDTDFTADLTIIEEGHELIERVKEGNALPMMTSCCPGWISYVEQNYPDLIDNLSTCKSPQQMFGALAKTYYAEKEGINPEDLFVVSMMPCTAKKFEAAREEMSVIGDDPDVDVVLTTRELGRMIRQMGIEFDRLDKTPFDNPFGITTGAAAIFGATGGVMEAALRTVSEVVNEKPLEKLDFETVRGMNGIKEAEIELGGNKVKVAVAHTLSQARKVAEDVRKGKSEYAFIEVMACPGGCIGGGGQPYGTTNATREERIRSTYQVDSEMEFRKSHENPAIDQLYKEYLEKPLGHRSHKLLHTHYIKRN